jgi:predicted glycoside hydrolase/deacetylase ChbG (UPF0249 family)
MAKTLAEQLGFAPGDRVAIVHVDDLGMCHAANEGGFEALAHGPATCGSVMVPCAWFQEAASTARAHPEFDLGVHLTLTSEWGHYRWGPVAGRSAVPSLLDDEGFLPRTTLEVVQRGRPEEAEIELRAQIQMALDAGIDVTHLDSHMGACFWPPFVPVYHKLALEFQLPVFAVGTADESVLEQQGMSGLRDVLQPLIDRLEADGLPILDGFCADSLGFAEGEGLAHNRRRLSKLVPGVSYLICHAARGSEELWSVTPDSAHQRDFERSFYGGEPGRKELEAQSIQTVGMAPIREVFRSGRQARDD